MASGIRWAETTSAAYGTSNSARAVAAADMTGQSESDPITMPTRAVVPSGIGVSGQVRRGVPGPAADPVEVVAARGDVADLAAGSDLLAVELHSQPPVPGEAVHQRRGQVLDRPTEDVAHHRPLLARSRVAERQVQHGPEVVLELR